jgi:Ser/Thr protein kinase RdoA (MazF antagonist)
VGGTRSDTDTGTSTPARFFDFGDATIADPFTTLAVPLRVARSRGANPAQLLRLRDSYLEVFTDLAPLPDLRRHAERVIRLAALTRATAWDRALADADAAQRWGDPVVAWLRELAGLSSAV